MQKFTKYKDIPRYIESGSWKCNYTVEGLVEAIEEFELNSNLQMEPDFQRGHVWNEGAQVRFVEAILAGGATNARTIYLNAAWWPDAHRQEREAYSDFVCVDGLQRYTAVKRFIKNEIKAYGSFFKEYEGFLGPSIALMELNINRLKSKKAVLSWYLQMNSSGVIHSKAELDRVYKLLEKEREQC